MEKRELTEMLIDTMLMEKAISYLTDSKLFLRCLWRLNRTGWKSGIDLRQSYTRTAKGMAAQIGQYAHAKQFRRKHAVQPGCARNGVHQHGKAHERCEFGVNGGAWWPVSKSRPSLPPMRCREDPTMATP